MLFLGNYQGPKRCAHHMVSSGSLTKAQICCLRVQESSTVSQEKVTTRWSALLSNLCPPHRVAILPSGAAPSCNIDTWEVFVQRGAPTKWLGFATHVNTASLSQGQDQDHLQKVNAARMAKEDPEINANLAHSVPTDMPGWGKLSMSPLWLRVLKYQAINFANTHTVRTK